MDQAEAPADMDSVVNNPQYYNKVHNVTRRLTRGKDTTSSYTEWNDSLSHDWAKMLSWMMDLLYTDKILLYY